MNGYLVQIYKKEEKVDEQICKSSNKGNAINTALRKTTVIDFDSIKIYRVELSYKIIED